MAESSLRLIACPRPFSAERIDRVVPAGGTIGEIMASLALDPVLAAAAHVWLCDEGMTREPVPVAREHWHRVRPKPGTVVTVRVAPRGGGGGKSPLRVVLTIAVIAAAVALGPALGAAMGLPVSATILGVSGINLAAAVGGAERGKSERN